MKIMLTCALNHGRKDLLEWALREQKIVLFFRMYCKAAYYENFAYLERLFVDPRFNIWGKHCVIEMSELCDIATEASQVECLLYLRKKHNCPWTYETCNFAAAYGHLDCLRYLHENRCEWNAGACFNAVAAGHLECLIYLHEQGCPWNQSASEHAADRGHLDCLKYLHENGCEWHNWACTRAAHQGHQECLQYLHENGRVNGLPKQVN